MESRSHTDQAWAAWHHLHTAHCHHCKRRATTHTDTDPRCLCKRSGSLGSCGLISVAGMAADSEPSVPQQSLRFSRGCSERVCKAGQEGRPQWRLLSRRVTESLPLHLRGMSTEPGPSEKQGSDPEWVQQAPSGDGPGVGDEGSHHLNPGLRPRPSPRLGSGGGQRGRRHSGPGQAPGGLLLSCRHLSTRQSLPWAPVPLRLQALEAPSPLPAQGLLGLPPRCLLLICPPPGVGCMRLPRSQFSNA